MEKKKISSQQFSDVLELGLLGMVFNEKLKTLATHLMIREDEIGLDILSDLLDTYGNFTELSMKLATEHR